MNSANGTNDKRAYRKQPAITDYQIDAIVKEGFKFFQDGRKLDSCQSVYNDMCFLYINTTDDKKKLPLGLKKLRMAFNAIIAAIFDSNCDELINWYTKKERMYSFFELLKIWLAHNSIRNCPSISEVDKTKKRKRKDADADAVASSKRQNDGRHTAAGSDSDTDDMTPPMTPGGSDYPTPDGSDDEVIVKEEPIDRPYIPNNETNNETLSVKRTNIQSVVELGHTVYKEGDHDVIVINDEEGEAEDEEDEAEDEEDEEDEDDDEDDEDDDDPTTI